MSPVLDHTLSGPTEAQWEVAVHDLPPFAWPDCRRLVVVSPHPDDETLGAGGIITLALLRGLPVLVLSVTDGEAASPDPGLGDVRRAELARALECLDPSGCITSVRLGFPDFHVAAATEALTAEIAAHLRPGDLVLCPLSDDGHPDHDATSLAATAAGEAAGLAVRWYPVWAWHCHDPEHSVIAQGERLSFPDKVLARKRHAVACYVSQTSGHDPVVPAAMLVRLLRPFEVLVRPR